MFSVSYSVTKRKHKNNAHRSGANCEASSLKTGKLRYYTSIFTFLCLCIWRIARVLNHSSVIVLRKGDLSLFMLLKLRSQCMLTQDKLTMLREQHIHRNKIGSLQRDIRIHATPFVLPSTLCARGFSVGLRCGFRCQSWHEALFSIFTYHSNGCCSVQHWMINAWIKGNLIKNASIMWQILNYQQQI